MIKLINFGARFAKVIRHKPTSVVVLGPNRDHHKCDPVIGAWGKT